MLKRKLWISIIASLLSIVLLFTVSMNIVSSEATAASISELEKQKAELEAKQDQIDAQISELQGQLSTNLESMQDVVNQKNTIDQEIFMIYAQMNNLNQQINTYNLLIADKQAELDKAEADLAELQAANKARIRAMEESGNISYWSVIFKAESFSAMLDSVNMINDIAEADYRRLEEIRVATLLVAQAKEALMQEKEGLEVTKATLDESQKQLEAKREEADRLLAELVATGEAYEALLHEAEQQSAQIGTDLNQTLADLNSAQYEQWLSTSTPTTAPVPSAPESSPSTNTPTEGITWLQPCNYTLLTSPFGYRTHPIDGVYRFHYGVDLASPIGTPITATRSGIVTTASYDDTSGYYVTIDHQDGFSSKYLHMTHYIVSSGEYVTAGQIIGYMGSTGASKGSHLHFSILYNGSHVNPMDYIS